MGLGGGSQNQPPKGEASPLESFFSRVVVVSKRRGIKEGCARFQSRNAEFGGQKKIEQIEFWESLTSS